MSQSVQFFGSPSTHSSTPHQDEDSDDDLFHLPESPQLHIFSRAGEIPALAMTVVCCNQNVKGNTLLELVHDTIQEIASDAIDMACEYEKDIGGSIIPAPNFSQLPDGKWHLSFENPVDWFMTLGGWKGMMPREEFPGLFFFKLLHYEERHFDRVEIFNNGVAFSLVDHRIHLPAHFSIDGFDTTALPYGVKTDLSYRQIVQVINKIAEITHLTGSEIAHLQLAALSRENAPKPEIEQRIPERCKKEIYQFLDFLNCLMFGVEPSGLNAGLAISLMTLELIKSGKLSYELAFQANADGGFYPYACLGNNRGTYYQREQALLQSKNSRDQATMRAFRSNRNLSPVAVKEAITIKAWLDQMGVIDRSATYDAQIHAIQAAIKNLINKHYFPHMLE